MEAALLHRQGGNENPAGLPSVLSVLLATGQVLDPLWASEKKGEKSSHHLTMRSSINPNTDSGQLDS